VPRCPKRFRKAGSSLPVLNWSLDGEITYRGLQLATFKIPRVVEIRDALPKSAVGKILRRTLREEF